MAAEEEAIMIAIDNSDWMAFLDPYDRFGLQLDVVRSYIRAKLKLNPKNAIGLVGMGTSVRWLQPTSDLHEILAHLKYGPIRGGKLEFLRGMHCSMMSLGRQPSKRKRRILFFTGGPTSLDIQSAEMFGKLLKQEGVAVDVIDFCLRQPYNYHERALAALIAASNNNNNSRIKHIQADSCTTVRDVISSIPEFIPRALLQEGDHLPRKLKAKGPKRENQPAALEENAEARSKELGKQSKPMEPRNNFNALSQLDNNGKVKLAKGKNQPAALDGYAEARLMERGKHNPMQLWNKFQARSKELGKQRKPMEPRNNFNALSQLDNNGKVRLAKGKNQPAALDGYAEARLMERGKHNPMQLRNKFQALSIDNNE